MYKLSICIPTYNRAAFLRDTLESICQQAEFSKFSDDIEIVISDNCSTDDTNAVCAEFVDRYPTQIKYFRNEENIVDRNFEAVLRLANGNLRKLSNDTLLFLPGSLHRLLKIHDCELNLRSVIYFKNSEDHPDVVGVGLDSFVKECSFYCTWIGGFCIWAEHLDGMSDFSRSSNKLLTQVDVLFRLLEKYKNYKIINKSLFKSVAVRSKGNYSYITVFLTNYFEILQQFHVSESIREMELKNVLLKHVLPQHAGVLVGFGPQHDMRGIYGYLMRSFIVHPFLTGFYILKLFAYVIKFSIAKLRYGAMGK